jgi:hypothetical protein
VVVSIEVNEAVWVQAVLVIVGLLEVPVVDERGLLQTPRRTAGPANSTTWHRRGAAALPPDEDKLSTDLLTGSRARPRTITGPRST